MHRVLGRMVILAALLPESLFATETWGYVVVKVLLPPEPAGVWKVQLLDPEAEPDVVAEAPVGPQGEGARFKVREKMRYQIRVRAEDGSVWFTSSESLVGTKGEQALVIRLASQRVRGIVRLGSAPLPSATLTFGKEKGPELVVITADKLGTFEGLLPRAGNWQVTGSIEVPRLRRTVSVDVPEVRDGPSNCEVRLIPTGVDGEVVDSKGLPIADGVIAVERLDARDQIREKIESGHFRVDNLSDGSYYVRARVAPFVESGGVLVVVEEGAADPAWLSLSVKPQIAIKGRLLSQDGSPVTGANVFSFADMTPGAMAPASAITDDGGRFSLNVPDGMTQVCVGIFPPTLSGQVLRVPISDDEVTISVSSLGGSLLLDVPVWNSKQLDGRLVAVLSGGCAIPPFYFKYGSRDVLQPSGDRWLHILSNLQPGGYAACALTQAQLAGSSGTEPPGAPCVNGLLGPGVSLRLSLLP